MAGTVTTTNLNQGGTEGRSGFFAPAIQKYSLAWTSDASGDATVTTERLFGTLIGVAFIPSGSAAPTANYDVTLTDDNGVDVLSGQGANLSNATATRVVPGVPFKDGTTTSIAPVVINDTLDLAVANAGNAKGGTVVLYLR